MRRHVLTFLCAFCLLAAADATLAQGTLLAHFPLVSDSADATGNNDDAYINNVVFEDGSAYFNGIYPGNDPSGSVLETGQIAGLDLHDFSVSVEFRLSELPGEARPILLVGSIYRHLLAYLDPEGHPYLIYGGGQTVDADEAVSLDEWHTAAVLYDGTTATYTIDGAVVAQTLYAIDSYDDRRIANVDGGMAHGFLGHLRNLRVYNGLEATLPTVATSLDAVKALYR